jgi:hypothetical protein
MFMVSSECFGKDASGQVHDVVVVVGLVFALLVVTAPKAVLPSCLRVLEVPNHHRCSLSS